MKEHEDLVDTGSQREVQIYHTQGGKDDVTLGPGKTREQLGAAERVTGHSSNYHPLQREMH